MLGAALTKYSANFGITHYGIEGMFNSIGYTTRLAGTPCWPAGIDAQNLDMGNMWCNDPEEMKDSKFIILWGVNPASNSIHTMKYIYEAKKKGAGNGPTTYIAPLIKGAEATSGAGTDAYKFEVGYDFSKIGVAGLKVLGQYAKIDQDKVTTVVLNGVAVDTKSTFSEAQIAYDLPSVKGLTLSLEYEDGKVETTSTKNTSDMRFRANYKF